MSSKLVIYSACNFEIKHSKMKCLSQVIQNKQFIKISNMNITNTVLFFVNSVLAYVEIIYLTS